jgi:hypothetical protein
VALKKKKHKRKILEIEKNGFSSIYIVLALKICGAFGLIVAH